MDDSVEVPLRKRLLRYVILGVALGIVAVVVTYFGVDYEMSKNCRSKSDPSVYGIEHCVRPKPKPRPKAGASLRTAFYASGWCSLPTGR